MKHKRTGFTVVEILTVVTIITILLGVLIPALSMVRNIAKETRQKAQLATIELALLAFRNDYGDYPPSEWITRPPLPMLTNYCGAQKLAEALLGWDLMGFHPKSAWRADGYDGPGLGQWTYDPDGARGNDTFDERKGPYLELATANAFRLGPFTDPVTSVTYPGLYDDPAPLAPATYVLCDSFSVKNIILPSPDPTGKAVTLKAGTPILYYRANTSSKNEVGSGNVDLEVYNVRDNAPLVEVLPSIKDDTVNHPLRDSTIWRNTITDPQIQAATGKYWPYNPDSYILISAGLDGLYGTGDDITNFGN